MPGLKLHAAPYSVYSRIARLVLEECALSYDFVEIDIFDKEGLPHDYPQRHPFSKIPALEHGDFRLYETDAIAQYLITAFDGDRLLPAAAEQRARCLQIMRICDNYAYPKLVWGIFVEERERERPLPAEAVTEAGHVLAVIEAFVQGPYFLGKEMTLADLWALPMISYLRLAPSGPGLLSDCPRLTAWFDVMAERASVQATRFPPELES
ncbi:glutathione S-transferase family protein [Pelagibius sp. Alg239-R121]|uniref:glutathione S-transferase family protein n=1 Tax=Pelagibius sp. Alg239-R121 TaxID=2993448 RepID=UPI0024A757D3|nr:glutathione S-transferase family protein [Pelagibius sp. Alg239-R121]